MNVVYSTSDKYSEIAATSIVSMLENCKDIDEINIYVIDMGVSSDHKAGMTDMVKSYSRNLYWLEQLDIEKLSGTQIDVGRWHISTFSRLFLLHVLPENMDRVIYIDCDMIIRHSLKDLWEMDMEDKWVMSADDCRGEKYRDDIGIPRNSIYTNNGLMVIDLEAWRRNNVEPLFVEFIKKYNGDITYMDQGVLNGVFQPLNKVKLLPIAYNAQTACYDLGYDGLEACRNPVWAYSREEFDKDIQDPTIVHFTSCFVSRTRPWFKNDKHKYREEFLKYRALTMWKAEPLWEENTKFSYKALSILSNLLPKKVEFFFIRVLHAWVYPMVRKMKNGVKS